MYYETYAQIDLGHLAHNLQVLKPHIGGAERMAVLKANAYGHGAPSIFHALRSSGVRYFATANLLEALALRKLDDRAHILVFGAIHPLNIGYALEGQITLTIFSRASWEGLREALKGTKQSARVHVKINTGFNRLGFDWSEESMKILQAMARHSGVVLEGIYSHLALASRASDETQFRRFQEWIAALEGMGVFFPFRHIADSISTVEYPWSHLDMVRLGAVLYGLNANYAAYERFHLKGMLQFQSSVTQVRRIPAGAGVSYDYTFQAPRDMEIAALAFGYGDGYPRNLSNRGHVIIRGQTAPLIGMICMDQCMADVSAIPGVQPGDRVRVFETDPCSEVSVEHLSSLAGTNKNHLLASLSQRVPRVYIT